MFCPHMGNECIWFNARPWRVATSPLWEMNKVADRQGARCCTWKRQRDKERQNESYMLHLVTREAFFFSALDLLTCLAFRTSSAPSEKGRRHSLCFFVNCYCFLFAFSLFSFASLVSSFLWPEVSSCESLSVCGPPRVILKTPDFWGRAHVPLGFTRAINRSSHAKWEPRSFNVAASRVLLCSKKRKRAQKVHLEFTTQRTNTPTHSNVDSHGWQVT